MENLLNFPQSCFVDRLIPKAKLVKASDTPAAVRGLLTEEFEQVRLLYVLRGDSINVAPGEEVSEIDVFYFRAKHDFYSINPFCALDNLIPRHTLYIIEYGGKIDVLMQHKRRTLVGGVPKWVREVSQMQRDITFSDLGLRIEGTNLDRVYFNLLSQVAGYHVNDAESLLEIKVLEDEIDKKRRQAEALQRQVRKEKQFNRQVELNSQARTLKKEIIQLESELEKLKETGN